MRSMRVRFARKLMQATNIANGEFVLVDARARVEDFDVRGDIAFTKLDLGEVACRSVDSRT